MIPNFRREKFVPEKMELKIEDREAFFSNYILREQRIGDSN